MNFEVFQKYIMQFGIINTEDIEKIFDLLICKTYKKGELVLLSGATCKFQYFIIKGALLATELDDKGKDCVLQIGIENSWIGDLASYTAVKVSNRNLIAIENVTVLALSLANYNLLLDNIPNFEKLFRILFQQAYIQQTERVSMMLISDADNRYLYFKEKFPELINRIEWKYIASYLNMSAETISRIKNKST